MTILGLVGDPARDGDLDDHKISFVQKFCSVPNFRPLGAVEAYNSYNGVVSKLVTFPLVGGGHPGCTTVGRISPS